MEKEFSFEWEKFINGFDAIEEMNLWDKDTYGEMESFCENILISVLMRFISVDGVVKPLEVEKLNSIFDFNFDISEVSDICENMSEELEGYIDNPEDMFTIIANANSKIAEKFKDLLLEACETIINSDDFVDTSETMELNDFITNLKKVN